MGSLAAVVVLAGCGSIVGERPAPTVTRTAPRVGIGAPVVGECHDLTFKQIALPSDPTRPVPCASKHTTQVLAVMKPPAGARSGQDDARAYAVGKACGDAYKKAVGGDSKSRTRTLYSIAWFFPTAAQKAKGARWMRCDVTLTDNRRAYPLRGSQPFLADGPTDRELRCGRAVPGEQASWEFVPCAAKHEFLPRKFIPADAGTPYTEAQKRAAQACPPYFLLYTWSLPEQWGIGDRWYVCWLTVEQDSQGDVTALGPVAAI